MNTARLPVWLKAALVLDLLIVILVGGGSTLGLWAMLTSSSADVNKGMVLAEHAATFLVAPLTAIACLTLVSKELDRRRFKLPAYFLMSLPVFAAPFMFWESLR